MRTPDALRDKLRGQWRNGGTRRRRLLRKDQWPLTLPIGKPAPALVAGDIAAVRAHIERWRGVKIGEVRWEAVSYQSLAAAVELPVSWVLHSLEQWVEAMADADIRREYRLLFSVIAAVDPQFHPLIVQQRQQLLARGAEETIRVCVVADRLTPAAGPIDRRLRQQILRTQSPPPDPTAGAALRPRRRGTGAGRLSRGARRGRALAAGGAPGAGPVAVRAAATA